MKFLTDLIDVGTLVPDNATNGEVLQAIISGLKPIVLSNETGAIYFDWDWWNAPYQKDGE